jgi:hypothetical protein
MNIIEITPPKQLNFSLPSDLQRTLTFSNLTLHSVFVLILRSHPHELSLSQDCFLMQAFEEKKVSLAVNWRQEAGNLSSGKLRVCYEEIEEEMLEQDMRALITEGRGKRYSEELAISMTLDLKSLQFLNYSVLEQEEAVAFREEPRLTHKNLYLMRRVSHLELSPQAQARINGDALLSNHILSYLQHLPAVVSIEPCPRDGSFLIEFNSQRPEDCQLVDFPLR